MNTSYNLSGTACIDFNARLKSNYFESGFFYCPKGVLYAVKKKANVTYQFYVVLTVLRCGQPNLPTIPRTECGQSHTSGVHWIHAHCCHLASAWSHHGGEVRRTRESR